MAKNEETVEVKAPKNAEWDAFLKHYQAKNPKKFAEKQARGEFKEPSAEFLENVATGNWAKSKAKLGIS